MKQVKNVFLIILISCCIVINSGSPVLQKQQNNSLDWYDYGPPSKLRALFFPELVRAYNEQLLLKKQTLEINCAGNAGFDVTFKNCSCNDIICDVKKSFNRIIDTNCNDICCRNVKFNGAAEKHVNVRQTTSNINNYKCGITYVKPNDYTDNLFNNKIFDHNEFPWTVQINSMRTPICVGTLIHPKVIMTTAVCIFMQVADDLSIKLNKNNFNSNEIGVNEIIVHEKFARYFEQLNYDIALLVLEKPVILSKDVNIVCLPYEHNSTTEPNQECFVSSWEMEKNRNIFVPTSEKFVMVPNTRCHQVHRSRRNKYEQYVHDGNICAASTKGSSQFNFSGAPLMCPSNKTQYIQQGILAWSTRVNKSPNIFTNVAKFRNWIDEQFDNLDLDKNVYKYD